MAAKSLAIIANEGTKRILGQLGSPVTHVTLRGRVVGNGSANSLVIEQAATNRTATLPIFASTGTKKALSEVAHSKGSHQVTLRGRVIVSHGQNVLVLNKVDRAHALPIVADASTHGLLADLASKEGGEVTVKAKVVNHGGRKHLVLAGEGKGGGKKK